MILASTISHSPAWLRTPPAPFSSASSVGRQKAWDRSMFPTRSNCVTASKKRTRSCDKPPLRYRGLPLSLSTLVGRFYASSIEFASTNVHAADHRSDSLCIGRPISPPSGMLAPSMDPLRRIGQAQGTDRDEVIRHIELCDLQLDALDRTARSLSVKTNWTYWHLGKAYEAFCIVSTS